MYRHPVFFLTTYTGEFIESYKRLRDSKLKTIEIEPKKNHNNGE